MAKSFNSSSVYNPSRTEGVQQLYDLMSSEEADDALKERFKKQVNNMSTANPYKGVLVNPRQCEVDQAGTTLDEVLENLKVDPYVPPPLIDAIDEVKDKLDKYREHTERLIANFPTISSIVQQEIGNAVGKLGDNPCLAFGDLMGSVLQAGGDIMGEILGAISDVEANIDDVEALLEEAIPKLESAISKAATQQQEEVEKIANAMMNMSKMNMAMLLQTQIEDPCLSQILSGVLTPEANSSLSGDATE